MLVQVIYFTADTVCACLQMAFYILVMMTLETLRVQDFRVQER